MFQNGIVTYRLYASKHLQDVFLSSRQCPVAAVTLPESLAAAAVVPMMPRLTMGEAPVITHEQPCDPLLPFTPGPYEETNPTLRCQLLIL